MNEFSHLILNGFAIKRAYSGATASQINYYAQATLNEEKPDIIVINAGTIILVKRYKHQKKRFRKFWKSYSHVEMGE